MSENKIYLGDSVYARLDGGGRIVLTTENGAGPSNTIIMEPEVYQNLFQYVTQIGMKEREE